MLHPIVRANLDYFFSSFTVLSYSTSLPIAILQYYHFVTYSCFYQPILFVCGDCRHVVDRRSKNYTGTPFLRKSEIDDHDAAGHTRVPWEVGKRQFSHVIRGRGGIRKNTVLALSIQRARLVRLINLSRVAVNLLPPIDHIEKNINLGAKYGSDTNKI